MKQRPRGMILAGAEVGKSKNSQTNCPIPRPQVQSFQPIGALSRAVISDLMRRHVSEPLEV